MTLEEILTILTTSSLSSGVVIYLTKSWISERITQSIKSEYDQKLETHKSNLKSETDIAVEKLKSRLTIEASKHQLKFSKHHEKKLEVYPELYSKLQTAVSSVEQLLQKIYADTASDALYVQSIKEINDAYQYFENKKIHFEENLCISLLQFDEVLMPSLHVYIHYKPINENSIASDQQDKVKVFEQERKDFSAKATQLLTAIESDFRSINKPDPIN